MSLIYRMIGALLITYFVSRLTLRLPIPLRNPLGTALAHLLSLGLIMLVLIAQRYSHHLFAIDQILIYVAPQIFWWLVDGVRARYPGQAVKGAAATKP